MYLKSLEISGFKSFAKKATLDFTSAITSIVGPNGSGKSNVAEAFQFALGEQSVKSLRGKRGEDLIWNGGGDSGRANRASVKLTFDNSRRVFPTIDFDEAVLERAVHRDSANEYFLNGSQVRLKDIVELLAGAHIGATGHHIISQGEADRILSASIRERREMIEDALGLKIYQWKKQESIRKLERTGDNMKQVESLRREIAPHLRFLKKQVEKVEKALELRRELVSLYKIYFANEDSYLKCEIAKTRSSLERPKKESDELEKALADAKRILEQSKDKDAKSAEVIALEGRLAQARDGKDVIVRELGRLEGEIAAGKRSVEKEKEKQKRDEWKTIYLKDVEEVIAKIQSFGSIEDAKKLFREIIDTLKGFVARHRGTDDSAFIADTEAEIAELSEKRTALEKDLASALADETKLKKEYDGLKNAIEKEKDTNREAEKDVFRIIARQNEVRHVVGDLESRLAALSHEEEAFKRELGEAAIIAGREAVDYSQNESVGVGTKHSDAPDSRAVQEECRKQIEKIKIRLEDAGAGGGAEVMKEYKETEERDAFLDRELTDLAKAEKELLALIADLDARIDHEFKSGIVKINSEFQRYFTLMFGGGRAELTVVREMKRRKKADVEDLNEALGGAAGLGGTADEILAEEDEQGPEGLEVSVNLPRKKVKSLMMLSGGERALTSIALLFAVSQVNPPPFIVLDETDAALDEANSKKYGDMIESLSKRSQLILITHNRETMSRAGVLYGVTMGADGASRLLSIAFEQAVAVAK